MEKQEYEQVIGLLSGLHKDNPHFAALPEAYLLLSKVLFEKMGRQQEALETVEYLVARFQKHPRFELIDKVWRALGGKPKQDFII
jgi:tetratricopeptide (TPR) repeat protein